MVQVNAVNGLVLWAADDIQRQQTAALSGVFRKKNHASPSNIHMSYSK